MLFMTILTTVLLKSITGPNLSPTHIPALSCPLVKAKQEERIRRDRMGRFPCPSSVFGLGCSSSPALHQKKHSIHFPLSSRATLCLNSQELTGTRSSKNTHVVHSQHNGPDTVQRLKWVPVEYVCTDFPSISFRKPQKSHKKQLFSFCVSPRHSHMNSIFSPSCV